MDKIEHIGIAVKDIQSSIEKYTLILRTECYKTEKVESEGVETAFFMIGDSKIELLQGLTEESPISKFIEKRGEGIHHIAYEVTDIKSEMVRFRTNGFKVLNEEPKIGADSKLVCFIHPKDTNGVLTELVQSV